MSEPAQTVLIEWHRVDIRERATRAWLRATLLVCVAMLCLGIPLGGYDRPTAWRVVSWIVGGTALVSGPTYLLVSLRKMLAEEVYLAVTNLGLAWQAGTSDASQSLRWEQIDRFETLRPKGIRIVAEGAAPLELRCEFTGIKGDELVKRLHDYRRRALMGLRLKPAGT